MNKIEPFGQKVINTIQDESLNDENRFKDISFLIYSTHSNSYRKYFKDASLIQKNSSDLLFIENKRIESKICVIL
jgi:hypothetical protein